MLFQYRLISRGLKFKHNATNGQNKKLSAEINIKGKNQQMPAPFKHLFTPINIGGMKIKNRIIMPAMSVNFGVDQNGYATSRLTEYFCARAKAGTGMIIVGGGAVDEIGKELPDLPALWKDGAIPHLERMTQKVKSFGAKFGIQLMHGGRQTCQDFKVAPSAIPAPALVKGTPKQLNKKEITQIINGFGDAAARCQKAGFDFIEIHAAHGYLINQFMSLNSNKREDEYGGSFENRIKFFIEIIKNIKLKTDEKLPIGIKINGKDYIKDGWEIEDAVKLAPILERQGAAYINVSGGVYGSKQLTIPSMYVKFGCFAQLAAQVKKAVSIPVVAVGRIKSPELADNIIEKKFADAVAMGRAHIADPQLAEKAYKGKIKDIRPCIGCCFGCIHQVFNLNEAICVVNPNMGREYLLNEKIKQTEKPKKILIIGAGPAGLAAARTAALKGDKPIIIEEKGNVGGMAKAASAAPGRKEVADIIDYFENQLEKLKVKILLNTPLNQKIIDKIKPDKAVIASGSLADIPLIKGISKTDMQICAVYDILLKKSVCGYNVIIIGGDRAGLTTADYLAEKGKKVVVLHKDKHFAQDMSANDRYYLRERLKKGDITLYKEATLKEILKDGVIFKYKGGGESTCRI